MAPRYVLRRVLRTVRGARLGAGGGPGARVLPGRAEHRLRLSAEAAGGPVRPPGDRPPGLQHRGGQRVRSAVRRHVFVLRGAGHRDRHADPRGRRRADGDQPAARLSDEPRRPGVSVQAHRARSGAAPQDVRDVHGEADGQGARQRHASAPEHRRCEDPQEHLQQPRRLALGAVLRPHRRPAEVSAGRDVAVRAERQQLPAHQPLLLGADQRALGLRQPHRRPARADVGRRRRGASRTGSAARTRIPISRSPPRWPAATSAWSRG